MFTVLSFLLLMPHLLFVTADLRSDLQSQGITATLPGDQDYDSARQTYNQRFTVQPAAIAYPTTTDQVSSAVKIGANNNLRVVAKSGGHSYIANGLGGDDGALVIDLQHLTEITIDPSTNLTTIQTGNRLGNVASVLGNAGLLLPHGTCKYVGFGGHIAFAGFGFTSRRWGLTLDTITAIEVVLFNGTLVRASGENQPELFWALRGAAPSFGITTSIEVKTFAAPSSATVYSYVWDLDVATAAAGLGSFQKYAQADAPSELGAEITLGKGSNKGRVYFQLIGVWYGTGNLDDVLKPLLDDLPGGPQIELNPGSYIQSVEKLAGGSLDVSAPDTTDTFYAKSLMTPEDSPMSNDSMNAFMCYLANEGYDTNLNWFTQVELYGGKGSAINSVPADATAFANRNSLFTIQFYAFSSPFPDNGFDFVDKMVNSITSNNTNWNYRAYPNYADDKLPDWPQRYYGDETYNRLRTLKGQLDPMNVFSFPESIQLP